MKKAFRPAFTATIPVLCGYLFIGFAFGVMLRDIGFGSIWSFFCSLSIYAGSGQYLLVSLLAAKASLVTVAVMTLLLNCRHIFYGLSFLETFHEMGRRKWYMIFSLTDETYSLIATTPVPDGVDKGWFYLFISMLDHVYWIIGCTFGALFGSLVNFNTKGVDFVMTALFIVIFTDQWLNSKNHIPAITGVICSVICLLLFGPDRFIIPAMLSILTILTLLRKPLEEHMEREDQKGDDSHA